jgi:hypothetical protein
MSVYVGIDVAPQAFSGGSHQARWRGAYQPECAQRHQADPGRDGDLACLHTLSHLWVAI